MNFIQSIRQKLAFRFQYLKRKKAVIEKYNLNDPIERQRIINQFEMMQSSKRAFGRKKRQNIKDKINFMIHHGLIKVVE